MKVICISSKVQKLKNLTNAGTICLFNFLEKVGKIKDLQSDPLSQN